MNEQRAVPRNRLLKTGTIEFDGGVIACMVRNVSISGAALGLTDTASVPDYFTLVFPAEGLHMPCHVIWRKDKRLGVEFR
jgi:hypothetical protein